MTLGENLAHFYRKECCWPYAVAFFLTLIIYAMEWQIIDSRLPWASITAYAILTAYYWYNVWQYHTGILDGENLRFFIRFLGLKIFLWGIALLCLIIHRT
jgi:hypothetical protein